MILPPSEWYAKQDLSQHFMRDTSRPFEEGVSRGQLRRIAKCEDAMMDVGHLYLMNAYSIVVDNRARKGREYGMRYEWLVGRTDVFSFGVFPHTYPSMAVASGICVKITDKICYVSAWADVDGVEQYSPVCLLCKHIYNWCAANGFTTMDIGIGGEPGLNAFKERLGFRRACDYP